MQMTHYMELLASSQPWNLIIFMVIPVVLAETVAVTELFVLLRRLQSGAVATTNRIASVLGGVYFAGVFAYLFINVVIPLSASGQWRGPADVIAVGFYLAGVIPLVGMALLDTRILGGAWPHERRLAWHAGFVALFLILAHIAMIFGMLDPTLLGASSSAHAHGH